MKPEVLALASNVRQAFTILHDNQQSVRLHLVRPTAKLANLLHGLKLLATPFTGVRVHLLVTVQARRVLAQASACRGHDGSPLNKWPSRRLASASKVID